MQPNLHPQAMLINRTQREGLNGHRGLCIWFTGLSGSGKSTVANRVAQLLHEKKVHTYALDGDNTRMGLNKDLGFTEPDRKENIRRVGEVCRLMADAGLVVLASFISPFRADRQAVRELLTNDSFAEVFVRCPVEHCEARDPKGLYKKARAGEISNFTGINSPYEQPQFPELIIDTEKTDMETCALEVVNYIIPRLKL